MCNIKVTVSIDYPYSRHWGNYSAHATVAAEVTNRDGTHVAFDCTHGRASGCGYDKESAATCYAYNKNNILQTLALWNGFKPTEYMYKRVYGYRYAFDACGVPALTSLMRANGFKDQEVRDKDGDTIAITYTRGDLPESFAKLF